MILFDCTIVVIFCFLALLLVNKRNIFSPWSVTLAVWIAEMVLYLTVNHGLYPTTGKFEIAVLLWVISFCMSSYLTYHKVKTKEPIQPQLFNKRIYKIMFILSVLCVPLSLYYTYSYVVANAVSDNIFFDLRRNASNVDDINPILKYISNIALIPLLAECNSPKINKKRAAILFILNILLSLSTMAKTALFTTIICTCFILTYNKTIKKSVIVYIFVGFIALTILFNNIRSFSGESTQSQSDVIAIYLLSPIPAFDVSAGTSEISYDGSYTFRFFYQVLKSIGFNVEVKSTVQEFVEVPLSTNVYTIFYQYYLDFGFIGVFLFGVIDGCIYGYVYGKINKVPYLKLFYSYLFVSLCLQFFNEIFFVVLSIVIQIYVLSRIIYYKTRKINGRYCSRMHLI